MNKTTKIILFIVAILIVLGGIWYGTSRKPAEKGAIKIGAILPLTGKTSYIGEYMKEGIELAKDEVNTQGGVKGRKLEIVYEDSQGDTQKGLTSYQKLVNIDGLKILLSGISNVILGIAPLAEKDHALVFAIGAADPKISAAGDFIFRHNLLPQTEMKVLADLVYNKKGYKQMAGIFVNTESGVGYRDEFKKNFEALGGEIKIIEMYEKGAADVRSQLTKIKATGVGAVMAGSYTQELGYILKQSKELGLDVQWFSGYPAEGPELLKIAGDTANGLIYTHFFSPESSLLLVVEYQRKYKERYGKISESYAALAYDNVKVLAEVMKKCSNPTDSTCVKNELYKVKDFAAVTGNITFDQNGDTHKEILIKTVRNGQFVPYSE